MGLNQHHFLSPTTTYHYFIRLLDPGNVINTYISRIKEDLKFHGISVQLAGYVVRLRITCRSNSISTTFDPIESVNYSIFRPQNFSGCTSCWMFTV